jgi:hypothetical protein
MRSGGMSALWSLKGGKDISQRCPNSLALGCHLAAARPLQPRITPLLTPRLYGKAG